MVPVTQITQYLYQHDPQQSAGRLTLYHYLKNATDPGLAFDPQLLDLFFDHCMQFQFWRERSSQLQSDLSSLLNELNQAGLVSFGQPAGAFRSQVLAISDTEEVKCVLENFLKTESRLDTHRLIAIEGDRWMALSLLSSGGVRARTFSSWFKIRKGLLVPLAPVLDLEYTSYLELMPGRYQRVDLENGFRSAFFSFEEGIYQGKLVQGPHYQTIGTLQTRDLSGLQDLFFALKRLEKHFIDPKSDPFYQELVDQLEKAYHLLNARHPQAGEMARPLLKKGQTALRNIFQGDKLLLLLVHNIEYMLNQETAHERGNPLWQNPRPLPK